MGGRGSKGKGKPAGGQSASDAFAEAQELTSDLEDKVELITNMAARADVLGRDPSKLRAEENATEVSRIRRDAKTMLDKMQPVSQDVAREAGKRGEPGFLKQAERARNAVENARRAYEGRILPANDRIQSLARQQRGDS